jgi:hypothetical protein
LPSKMIFVLIPCSSRDSAVAKSHDRSQFTLLHIQFPSTATTSLHCNPFVPNILGLKSHNNATSCGNCHTSVFDIMTHSHFDTWHHNKISQARRAKNMTRDSKSVNLTHFGRLSICNLFHETHLNHMTTSEESLRVLFFTHSLAVDLVHLTDVSWGPPQQIQVD